MEIQIFVAFSFELIHCGIQSILLLVVKAMMHETCNYDHPLNIHIPTIKQESCGVFLHVERHFKDFFCCCCCLITVTSLCPVLTFLFPIKLSQLCCV